MKKLKAWSKKAVGYLEGLVSIIVNLLLFAGKLWVGIIFNSIAMILTCYIIFNLNIITSLIIDSIPRIITNVISYYGYVITIINM